LPFLALTSITTDRPSAAATLTLDAAVRLATTHGYDVLSAEAALRASEGDVQAAGGLANPILGASIGRAFGYDPSRCVGCSDIGWTLSAQDPSALSDLISGKRGLRVRAAETALEAVGHDRADAIRQLVFATRSQYVQVARGEASVELALTVSGLYEEVRALTETRVRAGAVSPSELARAETAKLEADQDVASARLTLATARAELAFLLGMRGPTPAFVIDRAVLPWRALPRFPEAQDMVTRAFAARPDLIAAERRVVSAQATLDSVRRRRVPDVGVQVEATGMGSGQNAISPPTLSFGLTLAPPLVYQSQGEIRRAQADLDARAIDRDRVAARIETDVRTNYESLRSADERVRRMTSRLEPTARRARDLVRFQWEKGSASFLEFLDAQRTYIANAAELLLDQADYWTAVFALEQATAKDLLQ
jgi:outer membrane protein, heavy metal efflux system